MGSSDSVMSRFLPGLLLAAVAIQFMLNALEELHVLVLPA
jgi:small neutral amino acid transporter SnatA (MarC family)